MVIQTFYGHKRVRLFRIFREYPLQRGTYNNSFPSSWRTKQIFDLIERKSQTYIFVS